MNHVLTEREAYETMLLFLEKHYELTGSDDIGALLGALQLFEDNISADPAMWEDWQKCVKELRGEDNDI